MPAASTDPLNAIQPFLEKIKNEPSIGPVHISLYLALLTTVQGHSQGRPQAPSRAFIRAHRQTIMEKSKISGRNTYYRAMHTLHTLGFIEYLPQCGPGASKIRLL
ncbi:MAG: hypothetical protein JST68_29335 [Bacteroidetes bacterium]|nr:hypothetical protein [Bacteroidota bacterium]